MKRIFMIFLSLVLVCSSTGCYNESKNSETVVKKKVEKVSNKKKSKEINYKDELIKVKVKGGELACILTIPIKTTSQSLPVVLLVPGSGPVPKNGTANEFGILSIELANRGIASLRYDKRGFSDSNNIEIIEDNIKVNDYVQDISSLIMHLQDDKRFTDVFVLGHSQGALFSALAIKKTPVNGFISVAGAGRTIDVILMEQIEENELNPPEVITESKSVLSELKNGKKVEEISKIVEPLFRPSIQNYLIDWIKYSPLDAYKDISNIPILIIQGKNDLQIKEKDAKLLASVIDDNEAILIDKMSHVLKDAATKEDREEHIKIYSNVKAPLNEDFISQVIAFINEKKNNKDKNSNENTEKKE